MQIQLFNEQLIILKMSANLFDILHLPANRAQECLQLIFAPIITGFSLYIMVNFKFRIPFSAKVMLISICIGQLSEVYPSLFFLFLGDNDSISIPIAILAFFMTYSFFTYLYFALEL